MSFSVLDATHPAFAEAVRGALTGMLFSPAEINGHHVRQWVQQSFQFVIQHPTRMVATAGGAAGAGGAHATIVCGVRPRALQVPVEIRGYTRAEWGAGPRAA